MVEQTTLYDFLNPNNDPVYRQIKKLQEGDEIKIDSFNIRRTDRFYEVENEDYHEGFKTINKCYSFICSNLVL